MAITIEQDNAGNFNVVERHPCEDGGMMNTIYPSISPVWIVIIVFVLLFTFAGMLIWIKNP